MRFPPPIRFTAPLLALFFGLVATWFDYRLNLDLDLARHFVEMSARAESSGRRLAAAAGPLFAARDFAALQTQVERIPDVPEVEVVGVVDDQGSIVADSTGTLRGQAAAATALAPAAALINAEGQPAARHREDAPDVVSAHPFRIGQDGTGWVLVVFDRAEVVAAARADAGTQLRWMASAMALLSFALWAVLHFGFATRLARLADSMVAFGEGKTDAPVALDGGDEVARLSGAFSAMAGKLRRREAEQMRLEREVLEISETERQRIGRDLHDGLGQRLTAASMATSALMTAAQKAEGSALAERAGEIGRQLREAIVEARSLAHGLAPVELADGGLRDALAALAENAARGGARRCILECPEPVRVANTEVAGHLYRIAQEAVNNALKHAAASEIRIGLECHDAILLLEVDDDGVGLDHGAESGDGIGLRVMRYRARLIGGTLEIGSAPAGGARISCRVKLSP